MDLIEIGEKLGKMDAKIDHYHNTVMEVLPEVRSLRGEVEGIKHRAKGIRGLVSSIVGILGLILAYFGIKR